LKAGAGLRARPGNALPGVSYLLPHGLGKTVAGILARGGRARAGTLPGASGVITVAPGINAFFARPISLPHGTGISSDGSLGTGKVSFSGGKYSIPASVGTQLGGNLFESFTQFNLLENQAADFQGPASARNILARITGGFASSIDGTIESDIQGANLFLINPSGVMFGPNAAVNVSGSFIVTTGDHVGLTDGTRFNATPGAADAMLTGAPPEAYGLLAASSGALSFQDSQLTAAAGAALAFAAGQVECQGAQLTASHVVIRGGELAMDKSNIAVSARNPGEGVDIQMQTSVALANQSSITTTALADFGNATLMSLSAPSVSISGASGITSLGSGTFKAGNVAVTASELQLTAGGRIDANTFGPGAGGDVSITGRDVLIGGLNSGIAAASTDTGPSGAVRMKLTGNLKMEAGGTIQSTSYGAGAGGTVSIDAENISIAGGSSFITGISADAQGSGAAGGVRLDIAGQLTLAGGGQVTSTTLGAGAGGDVSVTAANLLVDGLGQQELTAISTETQDTVGGGSGGSIRLDILHSIALIGGGQINAATFGAGAGGGIGITAQNLFISGQGAVFFPGIDASSGDIGSAGGRGGDVRLALGGELEITDGGQIAVSTAGSGAGGSVTIAAPVISISGAGSAISAQTLAGLNGGRGGDIRITAGVLKGEGGGDISASTAGSGEGGSIDIAAGRILLSDFNISADTTSPSTVVIPVTVSQLAVNFTMDDTDDQNLDLTLFGPNGASVDLFNGVGGNGQNFINTVLADNAPASIAAGAAPFTGRYQPLNPLAAFDGIPFNGQWVLILTDPVTSDKVTLTSWSLSVGKFTEASTNVPASLPGPGGAEDNLSFLTVNLPPASIVPIMPGRGGNVGIQAQSVSLQGGSRISALTEGPGAGGNIHLQAGALSISAGGSHSPASIDAESMSTGAGGPGGDIFVEADNLRIDGSPNLETGISAKSLGLGTSGSITLQLGLLSLDADAFIGSSNTGGGTAGSVSITAENGVELNGGSLITTAAAQASAGQISIASGAQIELLDGSGITASAGTNGGSISLGASTLLYLADSSITATAGSGRLRAGQGAGGVTAGSGGNITMDSYFVALNDSDISANAAIGSGGNILIASDYFFQSRSQITATGARQGTVTITSPELDLSGALVGLPSDPIGSETHLQETCAMAVNGDFSSFLEVGQGDIEAGPDEAQGETGDRGRQPSVRPRAHLGTVQKRNER
jgi:filamentous hemagglutinin family protein